jgi:hypothetical protein
VGTVSAGLLTYYGRITAPVTVSQAVTLDDKAWPASDITESSPSGAAGSSILGAGHWLMNQADKRILVNLESTSIDELEAAYPEYRLDAMIDDDALYVVLNDYIAWNDFAGLSFDYFITYDGGNKWIPQCNLALRDSEGTVKYYASAGFHIAGTVDARMSMTYGKDNFKIYDVAWTTDYGFWSDLKTNPDWVNTLKDLKFKYFVMQAGDTTVDPNPAAARQVVWISNFAFTYRTIIGIALPTLVPYGSVLQTVEFRMVYQFKPETSPGDYTIVTNVVPLGFWP